MFPSQELGFPTYWLVLPFSLIVAVLTTREMARRDAVGREPIRLWKILAFQLGVGLFALAGAKGFSLAERGFPINPLAAEIGGGWRYPGALFGIVAGILILKPRLLPMISLRRYADWMGPTVALAHATQRIHCFMTGCCVGGLCYEPWGVAYRRFSAVWHQHAADPTTPYPGAWTEPVLPLHLFWLVGAAAIGGFLLWFDRKRQYDGQVFLLFLFLHEGMKFALEPFRVPESPSLQYAALVPAILGLTGLVVMAVRRSSGGGLAPAST